MPIWFYSCGIERRIATSNLIRSIIHITVWIYVVQTEILKNFRSAEKLERQVVVFLARLCLGMLNPPQLYYNVSNQMPVSGLCLKTQRKKKEREEISPRSYINCNEIPQMPFSWLLLTSPGVQCSPRSSNTSRCGFNRKQVLVYMYVHTTEHTWGTLERTETYPGSEGQVPKSFKTRYNNWKKWMTWYIQWMNWQWVGRQLKFAKRGDLLDCVKICLKIIWLV